VTRRLEDIGAVLFAGAMVGIGLQHIWIRDFLRFEPVAEWVPLRPAIAVLYGGALAAAGASSLVRPSGRGPMALATLLAGMTLVVEWPALVTHLGTGTRWTTMFKALALCGAGTALAGRRATRSSAFLKRWGIVMFGVSLPVYGAMHFIYGELTATIVPAWIPGRLTWAYVIGVAFVVSGVAIVTGVMRRQAAFLLGAMFATWVLILHGPRVVVTPQVSVEWTNLFIAVAMAGGAWIVGGDAPASAPDRSRSSADVPA
jgi:uncharacterized membrane protein